MIIYKDTKYKDFLIALEAYNVSANKLDQAIEKSSDYALPNSLKYDENKLSFGKLANLQKINSGGDFLYKTFAIVLMNDKLLVEYLEGEFTGNFFVKLIKACKIRSFLKKVNNLNTSHALRFIHAMRLSLQRITRLFDLIKYDPDPDEIRAGINKTAGSLHTLADWYGQRQGISDIEEVYLKPWPYIYSALKIETDKFNFQKELMKVKESKSKLKSRR